MDGQMGWRADILLLYSGFGINAGYVVSLVLWFFFSLGGEEG